MPKTDDLNAIMAQQSKALVAERKLNMILDQIIEAETERNNASDKIKTLWHKVAREGFDVPAARQALLRRIIAR